MVKFKRFIKFFLKILVSVFLLYVSIQGIIYLLDAIGLYEPPLKGINYLYPKENMLVIAGLLWLLIPWLFVFLIWRKSIFKKKPLLNE